MSNRSALEAVLAGSLPGRVPLGIYEEFVSQEPAVAALCGAGLTLICEAPSVREARTGIEVERRPEPWRDELGERTILRTPVGEISRLTVRGWEQEYLLKSQADYRVMTYIVEHTAIEADPAPFLEKERSVGEAGITFLWLGRSPMQTILVDYAGLEAFSGHISAGFPELFELAEALLEQLVARCRCVAAGPGRYVSLLENLTAEQWGPRRFARYHLPVYERILPILHAGGKKAYAHFDGQLACLAPLIAETELDGIESLTGPPEGDMTYAQARAAWPGKTFWGNINVGLYDLPPAELRAAVQQMVRDAAPDGRNLLLEVSEDLPHNWRQSLPIVLDALAKLHPGQAG